MNSVYEDKKYEVTEITQAYLSCVSQVNHNAATLVIECLIKMLDLLIPLLDRALDDLRINKGIT